MGQKIILFDIDKTLLDTEKMSAMRNEIVLKILKTTDTGKMQSVKDDYRATLENEREYVPEDYIKLLSDRFNFKNIQPLLDAYYGKESSYAYEDAVFLETKIVLNKLKNKFRLGIFSEGTEKFQKHKFKSMNLNKYFDKDLIFIFDAKDTMEVINRLPKSAIVVDDKESICNFLHKGGVKCIWLNKKDDGVNDNFRTIHDLLELPEILL